MFGVCGWGDWDTYEPGVHLQWQHANDKSEFFCVTRAYIILGGGGTFSCDVSCLSDVRPGSVFTSGLFSLRVGIQIFQIPFLSICTLNLPPCKLQLLELKHTTTRTYTHARCLESTTSITDFMVFWSGINPDRSCPEIPPDHDHLIIRHQTNVASLRVYWPLINYWMFVF